MCWPGCLGETPSGLSMGEGMIGCTAWYKPVFPNLVSYIENGEIQPLLAKTFPLERIVDAQREFTEKKHVGKFVLIPPPLDS